MRLDHETPTPEAAAQHARNHTPAIDDRWDDYEPLGATIPDDGRTLDEIAADLEAVMSR